VGSFSFIECLDPGSNWGPIPLQGSALPTELSKHIQNLDYFRYGFTTLKQFLYPIIKPNALEEANYCELVVVEVVGELDPCVALLNKPDPGS
jgi:hypothetical protein